MSMEIMKQAFDALREMHYALGRAHATMRRPTKYVKAALLQGQSAITTLRQAIAEAEKQEPVAIGEEWKPCVKLPVVVHVREQRKGEAHVSTREGITPVKEDDLIMRGVAGEEYPISRELFNRTYTFDTAPVHASDISQEPVDETVKGKHEWVKLTDEEIYDYADKFLYQHGSNYGIKSFGKAIEAKLKEKNGG